jgi:hypothetical protein
MRWHRDIALLCALAFCALAAPAHAHWESQEIPPSSGWHSTGYTRVLQTTQEDAIALWTERQENGNDRTMVGVFPRDGSPTVDVLGSFADDTQLATDEAGDSVAFWESPFDRDLHWRERPAGGAFGAEQTFATGSWDPVMSPTIAMNARGDLAFVWGQLDSVWAVVRPAGQASFGSPEELAPIGGSWGYSQARLGTAGELLVVWQTDDNQDPSQVRAVQRSATGDVSAVQTVSDPATPSGISSLTTNAAGRAILLWHELGAYRAPVKAHMSVRDPGGDFRPAPIPGGGPPNLDPAAGISAGGLVTIAYPFDNALRVYSGQFGGPFRRLRSFAGVEGGAIWEARIATSPAGRTLLAWQPLGGQWVTAQRQGDGDFGPVEDVDPGCAAAYGSMNVNDAGHTLAGGSGLSAPSTLIARGNDGPGHQGCLPAAAYGTDDASNPPARGGPPGGTWTPFDPSSSSRVPDKPLAGLTVDDPSMTGKGAERTISVHGSCGEKCYPYGSVNVVGPKGRVLYRVRFFSAASEADGKFDFDQTFPLSGALLKKIGRRPLRVDLRLKLADEWLRSAGRNFTLRDKAFMR